MGIHMAGNYLFVGPNEKHFLVASNYVNYWEIGDPSGESYYLEARIENGEFLINGRLHISGCTEWCEIKDNMPVGGACSKSSLPNGYRVTDSDGNVILDMTVSQDGLQCRVVGTIFDSDGSIVAEGTDAGMTIHRGPAVLGKSGSARGIVIGA